MATTETTTIRLPVVLRDEIARLADARGGTMVDVVTDAVRNLERDQWWDSVHEALEAMTPDEQAAYRAETERLEGAGTDGL